MILKIKGDIVSNEMKEIYEWFGYDCTTPKDVLATLEEMPKGDRLQVKINSGGGDVLAGQEIYATLRSRNDVDIEVEGLAASAASVIAMAGKSTISPVGMLMIHDVSVSCTGGNHAQLSKQAETLKAWDEALASAYVEKTGKAKSEIIKMMDAPTASSCSVFVSLFTSTKSLNDAYVPDTFKPVPAKSPAILAVPCSCVSALSLSLYSIEHQFIIPSLSPAISGKITFTKLCSALCFFTHAPTS